MKTKFQMSQTKRNENQQKWQVEVEQQQPDNHNINEPPSQIYIYKVGIWYKLLRSL